MRTASPKEVELQFEMWRAQQFQSSFSYQHAQITH